MTTNWRLHLHNHYILQTGNNQRRTVPRMKTQNLYSPTPRQRMRPVILGNKIGKTLVTICKRLAPNADAALQVPGFAEDRVVQSAPTNGMLNKNPGQCNKLGW